MPRSTGIYKKVGRRYVEIGEYDAEYLDHIPMGASLWVKRSGSQSRRYDVDPDFVPMLAASIYCEDEIAQAIVRAGELRPVTKSITPEQRRAYDAFLATLPEEERFYLTHSSARDAAEAGTKALAQQAEKMLANDSIRAAYEHFLLLCKLSAQNPAEKTY
jgi:hypothetical protein